MTNTIETLTKDTYNGEVAKSAKTVMRQLFGNYDAEAPESILNGLYDVVSEYVENHKYLEHVENQIQVAKLSRNSECFVELCGNERLTNMLVLGGLDPLIEMRARHAFIKDIRDYIEGNGSAMIEQMGVSVKGIAPEA